MGQCVSPSRNCPFKSSMNNQTSKIDNLRISNSPSQYKVLIDNLSAGDSRISLKSISREIGFLELFNDEVRVLSGIAHLESKFLKNEPGLSLNKDDLICLLRRESEGKSILAQGEEEWKRKDLQESLDQKSMTLTDEMILVTGLLFHLQGNGDTGPTNNCFRIEDKALEISTDSGLVDDNGTSVASTPEKGVYATSENKIKTETLEKVLEFSEIWGKKAILRDFLDDVWKYGDANAENANNTYPKSSTASLATSNSLRRNKVSFFGTARLPDEFKLRSALQRTSQYGSKLIPCYPVRYNFWASADDNLRKYFNNRQDRRILSICRLSHCHIQLLSPVRKNGNGILVQQISIRAPSLEALKRCCSMLDDVFPQFNASNPLKAPVNEDENQKFPKSVDDEEKSEELAPMANESCTKSTVNERESLPKFGREYIYSTSLVVAN
ncbi:hypothetical protein Aperf_G00000039071 [Anoplocephala perfoliata]